MRTYCLIFPILLLALLFSGCVSAGIDPDALGSPDERALYDLMAARCRASNAKDMDQFRRIYVQDSPELEWIENTGIPMWRRNGMYFSDPILKRTSIIGNDAAASFVLNGRNRAGTSFVYRVEALYVKKDAQWKIESTGAR